MIKFGVTEGVGMQGTTSIFQRDTFITNGPCKVAWSRQPEAGGQGSFHFFGHYREEKMVIFSF